MRKLCCLAIPLVCFLAGPILADNVLKPTVVEEGIVWFDTTAWRIEGKGWEKTHTHFTRLPDAAKGVVPESVWNLSLHSTGLIVKFRTDASEVHARHTVSGNLTMPHMTTVGSSGLDLYAKDETGVWRWAGFSKPEAKEYNQALLKGASSEMREYMLYLPLYNKTESLWIGVPEGCFFQAMPPSDAKPVVYYGTSIAHGCSASRPGMAFPAILGRRLNLPVINLGFSGNGRMEAEMADVIAEIDAAVYAIDCLPNMTYDHVLDRTETFIRKLRAARPDTPIVLIEDRTLSNVRLLPWWQENHNKKREAFRAVYEKLTAEEMTGLSYLEGEHLLGDDDEGTVDGSHPTDLGMARMADAVEPVLRKALKK